MEQAFAEIHKLEIIHGDVRAANILVAEDESVWILDFESAQVVSGSEGQIFINGEQGCTTPVRSRFGLGPISPKERILDRPNWTS